MANKIEGIVSAKNQKSGEKNGKTWNLTEYNLVGDGNKYTTFRDHDYRLGEIVEFDAKVTNESYPSNFTIFNSSSKGMSRDTASSQTLTTEAAPPQNPVVSEERVEGTGSLRLHFVSDALGEDVAKQCTIFGESEKVIATQTGFDPDKKLYYAFVFYK